MDKNIEIFIVPIIGQAQQGCGFFVGNYFITAGHVIEENNCPLFVYFEGKEFILDKTKAVKICYSKELTTDENTSDFAVFEFNDISSPLELADYEPVAGQELRFITYDTVVVNNDNPDLPAIFSTSDRIEKVISSAIVREEKQGKFFACDTKSILKKGNSGSPLLDSNNRVVGILRGGTYIPECCIFQNAKSIRNAIQNTKH